MLNYNLTKGSCIILLLMTHGEIQSKKGSGIISLLMTHGEIQSKRLVEGYSHALNGFPNMALIDYSFRFVNNISKIRNCILIFM